MESFIPYCKRLQIVKLFLKSSEDGNGEWGLALYEDSGTLYYPVIIETNRSPIEGQDHGGDHFPKN